MRDRLGGAGWVEGGVRAIVVMQNAISIKFWCFDYSSTNKRKQQRAILERHKQLGITTNLRHLNE